MSKDISAKTEPAPPINSPINKELRDRRRVIVVAGPTASGKSVLALELALRLGGEVVNADALQIYRDLPILSAIPDAAAQSRVRHHGYGVLDGGERCSVKHWLDVTGAMVEGIHGRGRVAILVGGTGLYIRAAMEGLAPIPDIEPQYREEAVRMWSALGGRRFRAVLAERDPILAERLNDGDRQRLLRGMEVFLATGTPLSRFQNAPPRGQLAADFTTVFIKPPRVRLYEAIERRYASMLAGGGVDEARCFFERGLDADVPLMKAVGLRPIFAFIRGEASWVDMVDAGCRETRRYAKRQLTWFNNGFDANFCEESDYFEQFSESFIEKILSKIRYTI